MAWSRSLAVVGVFGAALIALIAGFVLTDIRSSKSTLYCVASPTSYNITTLNASHPTAKCFRVENGLFTEVLTDFPAPFSNEITYLDGHILPGMIESHGHILQYGEMLESVSLYEAESGEEVKARIKEFLRKHAGEGYGTRDKWVRGIGWDQKYFGGVMPTAKELGEDPELRDLYMMLDRVDVHCVLTSQKVLDLLPKPLSEAPPGGVIVTDPGPGVFCDNAMDAIIFPVAPKPDVAQKTRWFKTAMAELNKVGIVGAGDAGMRPEDIAILENMAESGELTMRVNVMLECAERNTFCPEETKILKILDEPKSLGGNMLMLGGVKLFADGALGSWGAALLQPYSDRPDTSGTMLINETDLTNVVKHIKWYGAGFQVNIHAIGDRANRAAVDAFEKVLGSNCNGCNQERRLRIEHAQIIVLGLTSNQNPRDQMRIAKLGIIPSIQPTHATSDMAYALARLGEERLANSAYRMRSLFPPPSYPYPYPGPVLGSDFPVEPPSPFAGMYAAVTRLSPSTGASPAGEGGWFPDEKLSVEQALRGFTTNGAYGWLKEDIYGAIEVGKWADWVVIDRDIFVDESGKSLRDVEVRSTWVAGNNVFSSKQTGDCNQPGFLDRLEKFTVCVVERIQGSRATCGWPIIGARE
ncbi:putative amidohydrolase [Lachnellula subtilissima]|uniref:Putative amidohydrolase n=1 Tax=Lachnellula subtilissima TaxID=602034 RepID=A0A8H8RKQ8_9HELO|nr:putative amidohydrolase [Lachnellula subtilissima]